MEDQYEAFEITDYDLDNEFNPNRPRRYLSKNKQIYGVWADDSDNDSDEGTSRRRRSGRGGASGSKKPKNYTAPVSFVAGGIQQAGKKKKKGSDADEQDEQFTDSDRSGDAEERPAFGRKPVTTGGGASDASNSSDDSAEEVQYASRTQQQRQAPSSSQRAGFGQARPMGAGAGGGGGKNVGAWEQHTRGIGAKLLLQMGYKPGKGLGKDLQGISQPVEAHVRKGRGAIGAYGPEKKTSVAGKKQEQIEDEDMRETKEFKEKLNKWKKTQENQDKTKRYYYKSVEEVIEKGKKSTYLLTDNISKRLGNVPVIDMTGPEKRVLSGYHALGTARFTDEDLYEVEEPVTTQTAKKSTPTINFAMPELMHNLQLIVDMCEQDIISLDKKEREVKDRQLALEERCSNLQEIVKLEKNHIDTLQEAMQLVDELSEGKETVTLERAEKIFVTLKHDYAAEYKEFGLGDLVAGIIAPLVKISLDGWQPLEEPTQHVELVKRWHGILNANTDIKSETGNIFDPYSSLIWAGVIPSFRACAANWNPKQHQQMAALLDCWAPLFPTWILDSVLEQLVLPRLITGVREWDPLTDTVPIHVWILPWNTILAHKMEEFIFPTIRQKLGAALQAWMPQDRSARAMLTPWKAAFGEAEMQMFLISHIIPKLQMVLTELIINPLQQDLELWHQVWEWHELIPPMLMSQLLDKYFFPKWMQVLVLWLNQQPNYAEVSRWYSGWKSLLSEELLREPNVQHHMRRALEMMHRAVEAVVAPLAAEGMPTGMSNPPLKAAPPPPAPPPLLDLQIQMPAQLEFKELVSQKCAERGILFAPIPGRRELGKQVYRVGKLFCYIDRNVCMISDSSFKNWNPTSLSVLIERALTGII